MNTEDEIRKLFEDLDPKGEIPHEKIEGFIQAVKEIEKNPPKDGDKIGDMYFSVLKKEQELKDRMNEETDWRKKASLAAQIISNNLE